MLRKIFASAFAMSMLNNSYSQDSASRSLTLSGSADVYYKYDLGKSRTNNLTAFTNSHNSFELGMASLKVAYKTDKVEMVADLGFGKRAQEFSYNDDGILEAVKQLYISYSPSSWLKLTAGSWSTHVGYELVDAYANRNYSMSYAFTNGPFFHTGVKAEAAFGMHGLMAGISNPTDFKYVPDGVLNDKFLIAQYSFTPGDHFKAYVNYVGGQQIDTTKSRQLDVVLTSRPAANWTLAVNATMNRVKKYLGDKNFDVDKSWWSAAFYAGYDVSPRLGFTVREEYFRDKNGLKISGLDLNGSIFSSTFSANLRLDHFSLIPEFRLDHSNKSLFTKSSGSNKTEAFLLMAMVYQF